MLADASVINNSSTVPIGAQELAAGVTFHQVWLLAQHAQHDTT